MHPVLLSLGPVNVYSYGAMIALGFSIATFLIYKRAETDTSFGMDKDTVFDLAVLILVCGIAGSRILYVAINFPYYAAHPAETINISKGGLVWYGGFVASVVSVIVFTRNNGLSFWSVVDLIAPYLAMAQGFGRVGCFLNGCCYGFDGHPVQIYSAAALFTISILLLRWQRLRRFNGEIFFGYCMLYSAKRFAMEFLRADNPRVLGVFTMSQILSIALFIVSVIIFLRMASVWKKGISGSK